MNWTDNKILLNQSIESPPKEIFQAVCDELGKHYSKIGFRYSRSIPKLSYTDKEIKFELKFFSSRTNTRGESVCLDLHPSIESIRLKNEKQNNPFILGVSSMLTRMGDWDNKNLMIIETVYGERFEHINEHSTEPLFHYSNSCNVYGIDKKKFDQLVNFIDSKILIWIKKIKTEVGIAEILNNKSSSTGWEIDNSGLMDYLTLLNK